MARNPNTTYNGGNFDRSTIEFVWSKATPVYGYNENLYRKDRCGKWITKSQYGNVSSLYGWEIDHIKPIAKGGTDQFINLQPLHWRSNRGKSDNYPSWSCSVS